MDCKTARLLAEFRGNGNSELPPEDIAQFDEHLRRCADCRRLQALEQKLDAPIAKAMRAVPIPPGLKAKILDQLATQRGALYRKRFFYPAAAAAAIVIAVGLLTLKPQTKPKLDLNQLVINADRGIENPKERVENWLAGLGIGYQPPVPFNPSLLAFHGMATVQGKQVPMVSYRGMDPHNSTVVYAQVYLIRDGDFDLPSLPDSSGGSVGALGYQVRIHRDEAAKLAYVILFNGVSLEPFLVKLNST